MTRPSSKAAVASSARTVLFVTLQCLLLAVLVQGRIGQEEDGSAAHRATNGWEHLFRRLQDSAMHMMAPAIPRQKEMAQTGFAAPSIPLEETSEEGVAVPVPAIPREEEKGPTWAAATPVPEATTGDKEAQQTMAYRNSDSVVFDIDALAANDPDNVEAGLVTMSALTPVPVNPVRPRPQVGDLQLLSASSGNSNQRGSGVASPAQNLHTMNQPTGTANAPPSELEPEALEPSRSMGNDSWQAATATSTTANNEASIPPVVREDAPHVPWEVVPQRITTHCEMTFHFYDGHGAVPTPSEISALLFETTRYFTNQFQETPDTKDVFLGFSATHLAVLPNLLSDPDTTFRCDFDFNVEVAQEADHNNNNAGENSSVITLAAVHSVIDHADFPDFIRNYVWKARPEQENQFYQTHRLVMKCYDDQE